MKARIKTTGQIVEVKEEYDLRNAMPEVFYSNEEDPYEVYEKEELDFDVKEKSFPKDAPEDYWTRLEHQYAGMAMQGLMTILPNIGGIEGRTPKDEIVDIAMETARALVEKLKEKEEKE